MKFCYLDESGTGDQPIAVMVGVITDATRMHLTKEHWQGLLAQLSEIFGKQLEEFHTRKFYSGSGVWKNLNGNQRSALIDTIIAWVAERKHKIVFTAIDAAKFADRKNCAAQLSETSLWCTLGLHVSLAIQRTHQREAKTKGHTVLIFDHEVTEQTQFTELLLSPPAWTDSYYERSKKQSALDQLVDVPHFVDSKQVALVQVADLYAFLLRRHFDIECGYVPEKYHGEAVKTKVWAETILAQSVGNAHILPKKGASDAARVFEAIAPACCL